MLQKCCKIWGHDTEKQLFRGNMMQTKQQDQRANGREQLEWKSGDVHRITPLSLMLHGYGAAAQCYSISNLVVSQLHEAALMQTRALQEFSHQTASIWIEPTPISPMSAVIKVQQTQNALVKHLEMTAEDSLARFDLVQASANGLLKLD